MAEKTRKVTTKCKHTHTDTHKHTHTQHEERGPDVLMDGPTGTLAHGRGTTGTYGRGSPPTARAIDVARSTASGLVSVLASNNCRRTSAAAVSAFATTKAATHHRLLRAKTVHTSRAVLLVLMVEAHVDACARQHAPSVLGDPSEISVRDPSTSLWYCRTESKGHTLVQNTSTQRITHTHTHTADHAHAH